MMEKRNVFQRICSMTLALLLMFACVPAQVFAADCAHNYEAAVTMPTPTEEGYTTYTCTACGDTYQTAWLDPAAYEGMTLACVGDSITAGVGVSKIGETDYVTLLAEQLGMDYIRLGASGTTLCTDGSRTCNIIRLTEGYLKGADVVTIAMGINDFCAAAKGYYELGDIDSTDSSTIYGAVRMWCERIEELRKTESLAKTQFYFVTPVITSWNNSVTSSRDWDQSKTNIHGYTLRDLCNAIIEVANLYDVPVIDLNLISGMYYVSAEENNIADFGGDGVHPGEGGHEMMANALAKALLQNQMRDDHEHSYGSWITTSYPSCQPGEAACVCSICSNVKVKELEVISEHEYTSVVTAPTCTEQGYTTHACSICGDSYVDSYEVAAGHSYDNDFCSVCNSAEENLWNGRSAVFVGDSITAGTGTDKIYYQFLTENLGFGSVTAMGVPGSCISAASDYGQSNQPLIDRYQNIPSADLILIFMGTNDYGHETPLGSPEDAQDGTFYGALNTIVPTLVAKHTSSKIVFVTPLHRYGFGTSGILETQFTYDSIPNGVGATLGDYVDVLKTVCASNDVSVIDLYTECTLDPSDAAVRAEYLPDGLHPNAAGHEVIAGIMESHIRSYKPVEQEPVELTEMIYGNKFAAGNNQTCRSSSRVNYYLKAGTVITLKDPDTFQWACTKTSDETSSSNLGYFPDGGWSDKETAVVEADGWVGFVFKYRDETQVFELTKPLSDYITIEEPHTHTYENGICTGCGSTTSPYLQQLPEDITGCSNLYSILTPTKGYYTATKYDTSNGAVLSVVIPVEPGDRIAASSFGSVTENMGSVNGVRVTYLLDGTIVESLSASSVYTTYTQEGYLTVPKGVNMVSVPWWAPSDSNWLTLGQISKNFAAHSPKAVPAQAPTCTENGYTAGEICEFCDASLGSREEIPATGHDYNGNTCNICGTVNVLAILDGKYVSVLGDSISTFNGYSNDATVNSTIGGNGPRYDEGTADTKPGSYCLLESVDDTWWMHFANRSGMKLLVNNSWAGSQVFGGQTSDGRVIPAAYLERCINLHDNTIENNPNNAHINPDVIFVYLGINDYNFNRSNVGDGTVDYALLVNSDGTYVTPSTFGEAYGILLHKMKRAYPDAQIFAMTLLPENLYSVDMTAWEQHNAYIRAAAEYYDIPVVDLAEKCAITWDNYSGYMMDKIHPTTAGMQLISDCIEAELVAHYTANPPHTHTFESDVTAPTCTEQGHTTHTCPCGDSYVDDYVDAKGHTYENGACTACGEKFPSLAGKTISILGASISTYTGVSNDASANSTIGRNKVYYTEGRYGVYRADTWWQQTADDFGLKLLVNNSWSGSSLLYERNGTVGAYVDRCVQLHDDTGDNAGEMPDIIGIQMGTNDFQYYKDTLGTADIDYDALIKANGDGTYTYAAPVTSLEAAAIVLHKISVRYPDAEVYYLNISQRVDDTDELIRSFNAELKQVVEYFGAHIVDIYDSAITRDSFATYIGDGRVHPNKLGMDVYAEAFKRALIANTAYTVSTHTVSLELDGVTGDYGDDKIVVSGDRYIVNLSAAAEMGLDVTVTMGGKNVTAAVYANGTVTIDSVTDDVTITAKAVYEPKDYRWEFDGTDLVCVSGDNALTKKSGTTTDGVFSNTSYALEGEVVLRHDLPWAVEWKCEGTWKNSGSSTGGRMFTSTNVNAEYNARYIFKSASKWILAMGEKTTSGSHNYGIALADYGIDGSAPHTYRLENRIAADGSNMVWLYVDGAEIGPMNHYYVGTTDKNTTSDWLSGKDFVFPYMGTDTHGFTNCSIDYIAAWEGGHEHTYESVVTAPTCTEEGYTTYTCDCGDSYVDDYTDELGYYHNTADVLASGESLVLTDHNVIMHNKCMIFSANVEDLGTGSILVGHGRKAYTGSYLEITADKLLVYSNHSTVDKKEYSHGLNIEGSIHVRIDFKRSSAQVTITTASGTFSRGLGWYGRNGELFCTVEGTELTQVDLRWFSSGVASDVWMFGDSWFTTANGDRWPKYLLDDGYTDVLLGGYGGMGAAAGIKQFRELLKFDAPEYAAWFLGMNNGDRNGVINASWLSATQEFLELCEEYDITPILCTIPTTPNVNNIYKNQWIRESGYRYIDFELSVVENHLTGDWFEGFAASDLDHPSVLGAKTLYPQVFADFPELAKNETSNCTHKLHLLGAREAVCEFYGRGEYYVCTLCGGAYRDAEAKTAVTTAEMIIPATGHSFEATVTAPTCTEKGYTTHTCTICGDSYTDSEVAELGHTPGEGVRENETATGYDAVVYCAVCGEELSREYVQIYLPGDINGDGEVNNKDATRLFQYMTGWNVEVVEAALDVNGDGRVNNKDATRLFQYLSGWDVEIF